MLTTVLHICLHCFGTCGSICESSLFSFCSRTLDIRSDRLWQVRNIHVIPRILHALDVKTGCVVWSHEANAATGNNVQWGYHRLPSKSWLISLLSFFSITHYVDVPYNLKEILYASRVPTRLFFTGHRAASCSAKPNQGIDWQSGPS